MTKVFAWIAGNIIDGEDVALLVRVAVGLLLCIIALLIVAAAAGCAVLIFERVSGGVG